MAKVTTTEVLICKDCGGELVQCESCREYFKNGEEIICYCVGIFQYHYCESCKDEVIPKDISSCKKVIIRFESEEAERR